MAQPFEHKQPLKTNFSQALDDSSRQQFFLIWKKSLTEWTMRSSIPGWKSGQDYQIQVMVDLTVLWQQGLSCVFGELRSESRIMLKNKHSFYISGRLV